MDTWDSLAGRIWWGVYTENNDLLCLCISHKTANKIVNNLEYDTGAHYHITRIAEKKRP